MQKGIKRIFSNSFAENVQLIFELFDFDGDGFITKEDIRTLLSHVPLNNLLDYRSGKESLILKIFALKLILEL